MKNKKNKNIHFLTIIQNPWYLWHIYYQVPFYIGTCSWDNFVCVYIYVYIYFLKFFLIFGFISSRLFLSIASLLWSKLIHQWISILLATGWMILAHLGTSSPSTFPLSFHLPRGPPFSSYYLPSLPLFRVLCLCHPSAHSTFPFSVNGFLPNFIQVSVLIPPYRKGYS